MMKILFHSLAITACCLIGVSCLKEDPRLIPDGIGIQLPGMDIPVKNANLYIFSADGKRLLGQQYTDDTAGGMEFPDLQREQSYSICAIANAGPLPLAPDSEIEELSKLEIDMDSLSVRSWKEEGIWPLVSLREQDGSHIRQIGGDGFLSMPLRPLGYSLELSVDATGVRDWDVELLSMSVSFTEGSFNPFGSFRQNRKTSLQEPTAREKTSLQSSLTQSKASFPCVFRIPEKAEDSKGVLSARVLLHDRHSQAVRELEFTRDLSDGAPSSEEGRPLRCMLSLEQDAEGVSGTWTMTSPGTLNVKVRREGVRTRVSADDEDDMLVSRLDVWVYEEGALTPEWFAHSESDVCPMDLPFGSGYTFRVAANLPDGILNYDDYEACLGTDPLSLEVPFDGLGGSSLLMCGTASDVTVDGVVEDVSVEVVQRLAKVSIGSLSNNLTGGLEGQTIIVRAVYIINGRRIEGLFHDSDISEASSWFNCSGPFQPGSPQCPDFGQGPVPSISMDRNEKGDGISHGQSRDFGYVLYTGRNAMLTDRFTTLDELASLSSWERRKSRLVLECEVGEKLCYYPITLPEVVAGKWYKIDNLSIRRFGSLWPDVLPSYLDASWDMDVIEWTDLSINETI